MPVDFTARKTQAQAIVNVFETGSVGGAAAYSAVVVLGDGAGISYGRSQATDGGGNLDLIVQRYVDRQGKLAADLEPYLDELHNNATISVDPKKPPQWVTDLMALLKAAGADPVMQQVQDDVFDERYWSPAVGQGRDAGLTLPLSYAVLYDTAIQSGPGGIAIIRRMFPELPPARGGDEKRWTSAYVAARNAFLVGFNSSKTHPDPAKQAQIRATHEAEVRKSAYRTRELRRLIDEGRWDLKPTFKVLGKTIT